MPHLFIAKTITEVCLGPNALLNLFIGVCLVIDVNSWPINCKSLILGVYVKTSFIFIPFCLFFYLSKANNLSMGNQLFPGAGLHDNRLFIVDWTTDRLRRRIPSSAYGVSIWRMWRVRQLVMEVPLLLLTTSAAWQIQQFACHSVPAARSSTLC